MPNPSPANYHRLTASATLKTKGGNLRGMYVASTSAGTIQFFDSVDNSGNPITGIITPAVGNHNLFDVSFGKACYAQITGTLDVMVSEWE